MGPALKKMQDKSDFREQQALGSLFKSHSAVHGDVRTKPIIKVISTISTTQQHQPEQVEVIERYIMSPLRWKIYH